MNSPIISTSKHGKVPIKKRELSNSSDSSSGNDNEKINQHNRKKSKILVKQNKRRNTSKHKYKKGKSRSSSSDSSTSEDSSTSSSSDSSSISSSSEEEKRRRKKKQKLKKSTNKTEKSSTSLQETKSIDEGPSNDIPLELMDQRKSLAPMTKEEWEKRQSVVRRVYDDTTGRHRLIKGDGEVIEEIVSKERHKQINKQATKGDGEYFQSQLKKM